MAEDRTGRAWMMTEKGQPCVEQELPLTSPPPGEALIEVAGCGVCHTDISFLYMGVPTRKEPPLALNIRLRLLKQSDSGICRVS